MVDLPTLSNKTGTVKAPESAVSPGEVAAPFKQLGAALDQAGEALMEVAKPLAQRAGVEAVRTGEDGNMVVDRGMPILGAAGAEFNRAARMTYLAKQQPIIENKMTELRLQHPNDPVGFQTAAKSYSDKMLETAPDPITKGALETVMANNASHNYRTSLVETEHTNVKNALVAYQSRLSAINDKGVSLARQGGTDTPEYRQLSEDRAQLYKELTGDQRFGFPKERADTELKDNRDEDVVQAVIGNVQRTYMTKRNSAEAQKSLQDAFWGPGSDKLQLSARQRDKGVAEGLRALSNISAQDREAISENRAATTSYLTRMRTDPATFDDIQHNDLRQRAQSIGDYKSINELDAAKTFIPLWKNLKQMAPAQATAALGAMARGDVPKGEFDSSLEAEAKRVGISPDVMRRYVQIESGGDVRAQKGSYKGLLQLSDDEFARHGGGDIFNPGDNLRAGANSLKARSDTLEKQLGRAPSATELYLAHQQGVGGLSAHIANPDAPAWQNMASTAEGAKKGADWAKAAIWGNIPADVRAQFPDGVDSVTSRQFMQVWQRKVEGQLVPGTHLDIAADNASARLFQSTIADVRTKVSKGVDQEYEAISARLKAGDALAEDQLSNFVSMAVQSGRDDKIELLKPLLAASDQRARLPEGTSSSAVEAQIAAIKGSGVPNSQQYQSLTHLGDMVAASTKALKERPLTEAARKGWTGPIGPLDASNPDAFAGEIASREKKAGIVQQHDPDHGPVNVIDAAEGERLATQLRSGDPALATKALGSLGLLSPDNYKATMASKPIKDAVVGMAGSTDPARMVAGMTTMDQLYRQDANSFKSTYGESALTKLQAWQSLKDQFNPLEIAERMNKADDPAVIEARVKLGKAAEKELNTDPQGVANTLGSWADRWVPFVNAQIPRDAIQAEIMAAKFTDTYKALRAYGVDQSSAKELAGKRVAETWSASSVSGGQFMMHPPEKAVNPQTGGLYYPAIDGAQTWMSDQLHADLEKKLGPALTVQFEGTPDATVSLNYRVVGLIADPRTQSEIARGKAPSYQIVIDNGKGQNEIVGRQVWDYQAAKAAALPGMMVKDAGARANKSRQEDWASRH
ncbi:MAG: hypothetical protein ABIO35_08310 [Nitrobacter sp.]